MDAITLKRLAFIKHIYKQGLEQMQRPEPGCFTALLSFHDGVELFLELTSRRLDVGQNRIEFMEYWELIASKLSMGKSLPQQESMRRLNKARVSLKHHGIFPAKSELTAFQLDALEFFEEATRMLFGIEFSLLSLANYVDLPSARSRMLEAEEMMGKEQYLPAIDNLAIAFSEILSDYETSPATGTRRSPFNFGENLSMYGDSIMALRDRHSPLGDKFPRYINILEKSIGEMQRAIKILALGIDYRRYIKYRSLAPHVSRSMDGTYRTSRIHGSKNIQITKADAQYCFDFIVDMAIAFQEFDYRVY